MAARGGVAFWVRTSKSLFQSCGVLSLPLSLFFCLFIFLFFFLFFVFFWFPDPFLFVHVRFGTLLAPPTGRLSPALGS